MKPFRFVTTSALAAALLASGASSRAGQREPSAAEQRREPLCRRAAPLPPLAPEPAASRSDRQDDTETADAVPIPAPPPVPEPAPLPPPPPPPVTVAPATVAPAPVASGSTDESSVVVTGSRIERPPLTSTSPLTVVADEEFTLSGSARPGSGTEPQSGQLTAGDHDDLLNPELYARYVREAGGALDTKGIATLDTRRVFVVEVLDDEGRPVPFANVTLTCADGNRLTLATVADGTAVFFPEVDRLGDNVRVEAAKGMRREGGSRLVRVSGADQAERHRVRLPGGAAQTTRFDLFVAVDTTGSMSDELEFVKSELRAILGDLKRAHPNLDIRVGLLLYRDEGDDYVTRTFPFTRRVDDIQEGVRAQRADGGGDMPEAMDEALARAVAQDWRPDAVRALLLIADAPPHPQNMARTW